MLTNFQSSFTSHVSDNLENVDVTTS